MKPDIGHFLFHRMLEEMADAVYQTNQVLTALGPFVYQKLNLSNRLPDTWSRKQAQDI